MGSIIMSLTIISIAIFACADVSPIDNGRGGGDGCDCGTEVETVVVVAAGAEAVAVEVVTVAKKSLICTSLLLSTSS